MPFLLGFALAISLSAILLVLSNVRDSISNPDQNSHEYTTYANIQDQVNIPLVSAPHRDKPWAGVVLPIAPAGSKRFAATKASVTLPRYYNATGIGAGADRDAKRQRWRIAATVGIGARSSNKAYLQAGVNIDADPMTGKLSFEAWYQWWPDVRRHLPLDLMPGADVTMEVVMFNATVGKAVIRNDSLRQYNTQFLHPPTPEALLEGHDAEWLVESGEDSEPFDFGVVSFRQCVAYTEQQVMVVAGHGDTYDMHYGGVIQANVRSDNASVDVAYTASH